MEGAVCHCESVQGGSHHLAIDGCPSLVVKQAPVGLPKHREHCVPPSQETYHPKCCYPHQYPPTASPAFLHFLLFVAMRKFGVSLKLELMHLLVGGDKKETGGHFETTGRTNEDGLQDGGTLRRRDMQRGKLIWSTGVKGAFPTISVMED